MISLKLKEFSKVTSRFMFFKSNSAETSSNYIFPSTESRTSNNILTTELFFYSSFIGLDDLV